MSKERALSDLISQIRMCSKCYDKFTDYDVMDRINIREWRHEGPWFFPPVKEDEVDIRGFFGTGDVMLVAERPSTRGGKIPAPLDMEFLRLLRKYGLTDAHISDMVKCRGTVEESKREEIWRSMVYNCFPFLRKEIDVVKPRLILAMGKKVYNELKRRGVDREFRVVPMIHYSYALSGRGKGKGSR
ncbi:MAG: uracil-DNA glycosylase family protein [Candidatus Bathyarchaeia archaeon]